MTKFPPPNTHPLVWEGESPNPDMRPNGWNYLTKEVPLGSQTWRWQASWTAHLTNALHDAGWYAMKRRPR